MPVRVLRGKTGEAVAALAGWDGAGSRCRHGLGGGTVTGLVAVCGRGGEGRGQPCGPDRPFIGGLQPLGAAAAMPWGVDPG